MYRKHIGKDSVKRPIAISQTDRRILSIKNSTIKFLSGTLTCHLTVGVIVYQSQYNYINVKKSNLYDKVTTK